MPRPTFTIDSGRGLYLIWRFAADEDRNALSRYQKTLSHFCDVLKDLGADSKAAEPSRVLRIPFTVNSKTGKTVRILDFSPEQFTLKGIINEYDVPLFAGQATPKMIRFAQGIADARGLPPPDYSDFAATRRYIAENKGGVCFSATRRRTGVENEILYRGRARDIETLMLSRQGGSCRQRENALFLYRLYEYALTGDSDDALQKTLSLNARLSRPLTEKEARHATKSAENPKKKTLRGGFYHYSTERIIKDLEITDEEMRFMRFLKTGGATPQERKRERNRRAYEKKRAAAGKGAKCDAIAKRREEGARLIAIGLAKEDAARTLCVSIRTLERDLTSQNAAEAAKTGRAGVVIPDRRKRGAEAATERRGRLSSYKDNPISENPPRSARGGPHDSFSACILFDIFDVRTSS
ncbi:MAG: hypothetical protein LBS91_07705 [Clostridiales Family XIII bacterium]|jgi:hypothetical protein|nr:hypothetical protein [Clostridiales Family XIII bacterium]